MQIVCLGCTQEAFHLVGIKVVICHGYLLTALPAVWQELLFHLVYLPIRCVSGANVTRQTFARAAAVPIDGRHRPGEIVLSLTTLDICYVYCFSQAFVFTLMIFQIQKLPPFQRHSLPQHAHLPQDGSSTSLVVFWGCVLKGQATCTGQFLLSPILSSIQLDVRAAECVFMRPWL